MVNQTHAGGIVFKPTLTEPLYLVVRAKAPVEEWVFPKGHIESMAGRPESPEDTARREVEEETGVLAEVVASVGQFSFQKGDEPVCAQMFLMRYVAEGRAKEAREQQWLPFDRARHILTHDDAKALLDRAGSLPNIGPGKNRGQGERILLKQLDLLNDRMKETSATANAFLAKFLFGGLIAVIALLNADLVLLEHPMFSSFSSSLLVVVVVLIALSWTYFYIVTEHYNVFRKSHRMLKYKFELTLHSLLLPPGGVVEDYSRRLEYSVKEEPDDDKLEYPQSGSRHEVLDYLLHHHRKRLRDIKGSYKSPYFRLAMVLVILTMVVRLLPLLDQF